jgi:hypothetical protein
MPSAMPTIKATLVALMILVTGCETRDERLANLAQQALDQQAQQNDALARQTLQLSEGNRELATAAQALVEQDALARRELLEAQSQLQTQLQQERSDLDSQRAALHAERSVAAITARRDPVIAQALLASGLIVVTVLPLLVTAYALCRLPDHGASEMLLETALLDDLTHLDRAQLPPAAPFARGPTSLTPAAAERRMIGPGDPPAPPAGITGQPA